MEILKYPFNLLRIETKEPGTVHSNINSVFNLLFTALARDIWTGTIARKRVQVKFWYLNVLPNPAPVVCGHVGGVQERVVLQDSVDDSLVVFGHSGEEDHSVRALYGNTCQGPTCRVHKH